MGHPLEYGGVHAAVLLITEYSYLEAPGIVWHFNTHAVGVLRFCAFGRSVNDTISYNNIFELINSN